MRRLLDSVIVPAVLALALALALLAPARDAILPPLDYTRPQPYFAVGYLVSPVPGAGRADTGSATVVGPRIAHGPDAGRWLVATAQHVTGGRASLLHLKDGRTLDVVPVRCDAANDVCWMHTSRADLGALPFALVARSDPRPGDRLVICGYGTGKQARVRAGVVVPDGEAFRGKLTWTGESIFGDSGGGVFLASTGELVSVVHGGLAHLKPDGVGPVLCPPAWALRGARPWALPAVKGGKGAGKE